MQKVDEIIKCNETDKMTKDEFEEYKVKSYNESIGDLKEEDGIDCPICKNKGFIKYIQKQNNRNYVKVKYCECMEQREMVKRAKKSGLGEYVNKRFKDFIAKEEWQKQCKKMVFDYCNASNDINNWFVVIGQVGAGKTLLCSIVANNFLFNLKKQVLYITWTDFISRLKRDMMGEQTNEVSEYLEEIKNVEVLFLDEVLKKYNETDLKYLMEIINYRYTKKLITLMTSEKEREDLLNIDEATFSRIIEMSGKYFIEIPKDRNKNYRLKKEDN